METLQLQKLCKEKNLEELLKTAKNPVLIRELCKNAAVLDALVEAEKKVLKDPASAALWQDDVQKVLNQSVKADEDQAIFRSIVEKLDKLTEAPEVKREVKNLVEKITKAPSSEESSGDPKPPKGKEIEPDKPNSNFPLVLCEPQTPTVVEPPLTIDGFLKLSDEFQKEFHHFLLDNNTVKALLEKDANRKETIEHQIRGVKIIIDHDVYVLAETFFKFKKTNGTKLERKVYEKLNDTNDFIDRLLMKRPLTFYEKSDTTLLRTDRHRNVLEVMADLAEWKNSLNPDCQIDTQHWEAVGVEDEEMEPLVMEEYLTFEEMEISALINVAVPTFFINRGTRLNAGRENNEDFTPQGIYIGAVGARFENAHMETRHMMTASDPAIAKLDPVLQVAWSKLYKVQDKGLVQTLKDKFVSKDAKTLVDDVYYIRMRLSYLPIILHAQQEGKRQDRFVVLRLTGLGTGSWAVDKPHQEEVINKVINDVIASYELDHVKLIQFQWLPTTEGTRKDVKGHAIEVKYNQGSPADPLPTDSYLRKDGAEPLLVAMYAWDGNGFPGNEYWIGQIIYSGDPAAACCSTIQELQNPYINTGLRAKYRLVTYQNVIEKK